jgi:hypothetical protein
MNDAPKHKTKDISWVLDCLQKEIDIAVQQSIHNKDHPSDFTYWQNELFELTALKEKIKTLL